MKKRLVTFVLMLAFILSIIRPSPVASAKSVDDYKWSEKQAPIFVGVYSTEDAEYQGTVHLSYGKGNSSGWALALCSWEDYYNQVRDGVAEVTFNEHLGFTKYFLGNYKLVLQYGDKFAPLTKSGLGEWGSLDTSLSQAEVIADERIPFNFNFPNSSTYDDYCKAIESSTFLVFDKDGNAQFKVNLSDFGDAATSYTDMENAVSEYEYGESTLSAKVTGKGSNGGFNVEVTWKFSNKDTYLKDVNVTGLKHTLVSGDNKKPSGTCVYEYTGIDYNAGVLGYVATDSLDNNYTGDIVVRGIYENSVDSEVKPVTGEENKSDKMVRPKVTVKGIPKKVAVGDSFKVLLSTDVSATMSLNGMSNGGYHKSNKFDITSNGTYTYRAVSKSGGITEGTFEVKCFKGQSGDSSAVTTAFKRYGDDSAFTQLVQTGLGDVRVIIAGISALVLGILLILEGRFKVISRGIKVCKSKFMSFMAVLLVASMLSGTLGGVSVEAADRAVAGRSGGSAPGSNHASTYVSAFTYGVRMYLVPKPNSKSKSGEAIVRYAKTPEKDNSKLAKKGTVEHTNLEYAINAATNSNYPLYKKYSKNALYSNELLEFIPSSERSHSKGIDRYSGKGKEFPSLGTIKIGGSGADVQKVDNWINKKNGVLDKLNARFGLPPGIKYRNKRYKQLSEVLKVFKNEFDGVSGAGYIQNFKATKDGDEIKSNFYLVTELVVGCVTNGNKKGILTSRSYNCKYSCYYGGTLGGVCFGPGNKFEACAIRTSFMGAENFATVNLKAGKPGKRWDVINPYSKLSDSQAEKYGGIGVYFGWATKPSDILELTRLAFVSATNFMITYDGAVGNTGEADNKIKASDVGTRSNFTLVKNLYERDGKEPNLVNKCIWASDGDPICVENAVTGSNGSYPANAYYFTDSSVSKVSDNAHTLGMSTDTKTELNKKYSKKNRLYAYYNISPLADVEDITISTSLFPQDLDRVSKEHKSEIQKALRLDWEAEEYNSGSGSVFGAGQCFKLANVYMEDSNYEYTGTNGGFNDNQGEGKLDSIGNYVIKLLNGGRDVVTGEFDAPDFALTEAGGLDEVETPSKELSNAQFANYVLNTALIAKCGHDEVEIESDYDDSAEDVDSGDEVLTTETPVPGGDYDADEPDVDVPDVPADTEVDDSDTDSDDFSDLVEPDETQLVNTKLMRIDLVAKENASGRRFVNEALDILQINKSTGLLNNDPSAQIVSMKGDYGAGQDAWDWGKSPQSGLGIEVFVKKEEVKSQIVYVKVEGSRGTTAKVDVDESEIKKYETAEFEDFIIEDDAALYAIIVPNSDKKSAIPNDEENGIPSKGSRSNISALKSAVSSARGGDAVLEAFKGYFGEDYTQSEVAGGQEVRLGCEHVDTDGDDVAENYGYTVYVLSYTGPTAGEGYLYLEDYELNHIWADYVYDSQNNANKINGTNEAIYGWRITSLAEHDNWAYDPDNASSYCHGYPYYRNKRRDNVVIKEEVVSGDANRLTYSAGHSESMEDGVTITWDNERIDAGKSTTYLLYNTGRANWSERKNLVKSGYRISLEDVGSYNVTYAYNLIRAAFKDVRTVSDISKENTDRTKDYAKDVLKCDIGDKPLTAPVGAGKLAADAGDKLRNSKAYIAGEYLENFITDMEWDFPRVNLLAASHKEYQVCPYLSPCYWVYKDHDTTTSSARMGITQEWTKYNWNTGSIVERGSWYEFLVHELCYKYLTKNDTRHSGSESTGINTKVTTSQLLSTADICYPAGDSFANGGGIKRTDEYRIAYTNNPDDIDIKYYPEVPMGAYTHEGTSATVASIDSTAQLIITMGEQLRTSRSSSLYLFRVRKSAADGADEVTGSVLSDNFVTDDETSGASGNLPSIYAGGDVTVKADPNFYIDLFGYSLDIVRQSDNGKMLGVTQSGADTNVAYNDIIASGADVAGDWGNDTDTPAKLEEDFEEWAREMLALDNFAADARLEVTNPNKTYSNFNAVVGSVNIPQGKNGDNPNATAEHVYPLIIQKGQLVKSDNVCDGKYKNGYKRLIKQIMKDYGLDVAYGETEGYARAEKVFEASGLYTSIIDSIESSSGDSRNKSQKSPAGSDLGSGDHWYDEEVRTIVVRRFKLAGNKLGDITLQDKIDYGAAPDADSSTVEGNMSKLAGAKWYLTVYFGKKKGADNIKVKIASQPGVMGEMKLYDPADLSSAGNARGTYNILIDGAHISGADFNIPAGTTDNTEW